MATRSGVEFRAGTTAPGTSEDMPDWARTLVRNLEECWRGNEESRVQIEFLVAQLLELKTEKTAEAPCPAGSETVEPCFNQPLAVRAEEPQWDAAK